MRTIGFRRSILKNMVKVLLITALLLFNIYGVTQASVPTTTPPNIDGVVTLGEWVLSEVIPLPHGTMHTKHDANFLYVLLDLTGDTLDDLNDYFYLTFDVNLNEIINSGTDINYGITVGNTLCLQYYLGPSVWTGCSSPTSQLGIGFGPSHNSSINHRIFELAISRAEISALTNDYVRVGIRTSSTNPFFKDNVPVNFTDDFSNLLYIYFSQPEACVGQICYYSCEPGACSESNCLINVPGMMGCMSVGQINYCGCIGMCPASSCVVFVPSL
jgi:hypothetical protein